MVAFAIAAACEALAPASLEIEMLFSWIVHRCKQQEEADAGARSIKPLPFTEACSERRPVFTKWSLAAKMGRWPAAMTELKILTLNCW